MDRSGRLRGVFVPIQQQRVDRVDSRGQTVGRHFNGIVLFCDKRIDEITYKSMFCVAGYSDQRDYG